MSEPVVTHVDRWFAAGMVIGALACAVDGDAWDDRAYAFETDTDGSGGSDSSSSSDGSSSSSSTGGGAGYSYWDTEAGVDAFVPGCVLSYADDACMGFAAWRQTDSCASRWTLRDTYAESGQGCGLGPVRGETIDCREACAEAGFEDGGECRTAGTMCGPEWVGSAACVCYSDDVETEDPPPDPTQPDPDLEQPPGWEQPGTWGVSSEDSEVGANPFVPGCVETFPQPECNGQPDGLVDSCTFVSTGIPAGTAPGVRDYFTTHQGCGPATARYETVSCPWACGTLGFETGVCDVEEIACAGRQRNSAYCKCS